ncbi:unnamed protein product, partial [Mesorhabditis spiculigera]
MPRARLTPEQQEALKRVDLLPRMPNANKSVFEWKPVVQWPMMSNGNANVNAIAPGVLHKTRRIGSVIVTG